MILLRILPSQDCRMLGPGLKTILSTAGYIDQFPAAVTRAWESPFHTNQTRSLVQTKWSSLGQEVLRNLRRGGHRMPRRDTRKNRSWRRRKNRKPGETEGSL